MIDGFRGLDIEQVFLYIYLLLTGTREEILSADLTVLFFEWWERIALASSIVTPILLVALSYTLIRYKQVRMEEMEAFKAKARLPHLESQAPKNAQWQSVLELAASERPSDWRVAILEADIMLDDLLQGMGYMGDNLGERLKSIERGDMQSLDAAWEAHKVRNEIAHGGDFILTQREARRVMDFYRQVFEEFDYI